MSEWKKYDETEFTDFGSVGETMPAEDSDFGGFGGGSTVPADGFGAAGTPFEATMPDIPSGIPTDSWANSTETTFDDPSIVNEAGQSVRPATGWLVCI